MRERHVVLDAEAADDALDAALGGKVSDAGAHRVGRLAEDVRRHRRCVTSPVERLGAEECAAERLAAGALDAGNAEHLAGMEVEAHVLEGAALVRELVDL